MFRVIGAAVVYGLALYGVVKLFDQRRLAMRKAGESTVSAEAQPGNSTVSREPESKNNPK